MAEPSNYGILLNTDIKLHRNWFIEMCNLIGIKVIFRAPLPNKTYSGHGELNSFYNLPKLVGCIFEEHPAQQTMKKLGWVSELQEESSIIHVPYDLEGLQQGALFIIPSGIDMASGRLFRVVKMSNIIIYPASITCEIVPEYENEFVPENLTHKHTDFNLLNVDGNSNIANGSDMLNDEENR